MDRQTDRQTDAIRSHDRSIATHGAVKKGSEIFYADIQKRQKRNIKKFVYVK